MKYIVLQISLLQKGGLLISCLIIPILIDSNPNKTKNSKLCQSSVSLDDNCNEEFSYIPLILIFLSQFVLGIGNTLYYSLGPTYIDNNTKKRNTPLIFSYAYALRILGPTIGFGFAYVILRIYIVPTLTPVIPKDDQRWMGDWWLGWILIGILMFVFAGIIGSFPTNLKREETDLANEKCGGSIERKVQNNKNDELEGMKNFLQK